MALIPARPTLYKGIQMRSRLEADFAQRYLDGGGIGQPVAWDYEPQCFASDEGQYLPDFRVSWTDPSLSEAARFTASNSVTQYIEIKPRVAIADKAEAEVDSYLRKMEIIWSSEPQVDLFLFFWEYGGVGSYVLYAVTSKSRIWLATPFPASSAIPPTIYRGRGQFGALVKARLAAG